MPPDDDPDDDWADAPATVSDGVPRVIETPVDPRHETAPHDVRELPGYEVARRAMLEEVDAAERRGILIGRQEVFDALRLAFRALEVAPDLPPHLEAWVRKRLPPV